MYFFVLHLIKCNNGIVVCIHKFVLDRENAVAKDTRRFACLLYKFKFRRTGNYVEYLGYGINNLLLVLIPNRECKFFFAM